MLCKKWILRGAGLESGPSICLATAKVSAANSVANVVS